MAAGGEASIATTMGHVTIAGFDEKSDPFPNAAVAGSSAYRVRASANSRAIEHDTAVTEVKERYLLEIWPERPSPAEVIAPSEIQ